MSTMHTHTHTHTQALAVTNIMNIQSVIDTQLKNGHQHEYDCLCVGQSCAPGFYRVQRGRYLGECIPCNCNGHSNDCDAETGVCSVSTHAPHCMLWVPMHYRYWCLPGEYMCTAGCGYAHTTDTGVCRMSTCALHSEYQCTVDDYMCTCRLSAQWVYMLSLIHI